MGNNRRTYWILAGAWTGLIYSTLYIVRPAVNILKEATPFSEVIQIGCLLLLFLLITGIIQKVGLKKPSSYCILGVVVIAYLGGLASLDYPEEKIHFIEYGLLAVLIFKALRFDIKGFPCFVYAFILTLGLGWIDEGIQYVLPNRYYQIQDVVLNGISGALALVIMFVIEKESVHD